jgi:uncharacterized Zn finger protein
VENLRQIGDRITATVQGTDEYEVSLRANEESLEFSCSCPYALEGAFCKHCVAVGLEWLEQGEPAASEGQDAIRKYLDGLNKNELTRILIEHAGFDSNLHHKLALKAAAATGFGESFKKVIDRAMRTRSFVSYQRMPAYVREAREIIDQIERLLAEEENEKVIVFSEHAIKAAEHTLQQCDDSDGYMSEILGRLQDVHWEACDAGRPDGVALAKRLFAWELRSGFDVFSGAAQSYSEVLGKEGLLEYRKLAEVEWAKIPVLSAGEKEDFGTKRSTVTAMMEALAKASGDLQAIVEIKKRDLSSAYRYLELATLLLQLDSPDLAIEWAEKGLAAFPSRTDERLSKFLADQYEQLGDTYRSMEIAWKNFSKNPGFMGYPELKERAERVNQWELWRPKAIGLIRESIQTQNRTHATNYFSPKSSALVSVYLWEGDAETAWLEAREGGCSARLMLQLAEIREELHPEDAMPIYKAHVEALVHETNNNAYEQAVSYIGRIAKMEPPSEFDRYIAALQSRHKAKRNFIKLLGRLAPTVKPPVPKNEPEPDHQLSLLPGVE